MEMYREQSQEMRKIVEEFLKECETRFSPKMVMYPIIDEFREELSTFVTQLDDISSFQEDQDSN